MTAHTTASLTPETLLHDLLHGMCDDLAAQNAQIVALKQALRRAVVQTKRGIPVCTLCQGQDYDHALTCLAY